MRSFASDVQARVMLFALNDPRSPGRPPQEAADQFAAELRRSPDFAEAVVLGDSSSQDRLAREVFERRFELLLPGWLGDREREFAATGQPPDRFAAWLAERAAADLENFLAQPEAAALQDLIPSDPLLLAARVAERARLAAPGATDFGGHALVWARIVPSPLVEAGQQPVFAAIDRALATVRERHVGVQLQWTGVNRFAAASRERIETEIRTLNVLSVVAVLVVSAVFVRRIHKVAHLAPVILLSLLGAWTVSTLVFARLHILVFVIGSLLSGVAIDYGVYIYMQPFLSPEETYGGKLRRLLRPLLASCLTTVLGFSFLIWSDLPLIREVGLFVAAGLLCALGGAMLYFAQLDHPYLPGRRFTSGSLATGGRGLRRVAAGLLVVAVAVAAIGPWRLKWRDDVRELDIRNPALNANEDHLRALFGDRGERTTFLTYGATAAQARQNLEEFHRYLARVAPQVATSSLGLLLPTEQDWREFPGRLRRLGAFPDEFRAALQRHGFSADAFEPFFGQWRKVQSRAPAGDYAQLAASVTSMLHGPLSLLAGTHAPFWFLTVASGPVAATLPSSLDTVGLNQLQSLNGLFMRYRWSALRLSLIGLALVIASVFAIYPFRRALRIAAIPAGSCFFIFGVLGLAGQTLNLFNLLGAFLGVCLSHNYAIFSAETSGPGGTPPVSIRLSALCAASSFGVLAFSHIPVIHALGLTVAGIVVTALAVVEVEALSRQRA